MTDEQQRSQTMRIDLGDRINQVDSGAAMRPHRIRESQRRVIKFSKKVSRARQVGGPAFNELLQNIYDGVLLTKLDGGIVSANERALLFFGCRLDDVCALNIVDILSGADEQLIPTVLSNLKNDQFTLIQGYMIRKDGSSFPSEVTANRLKVSGEEYLIFFVRDITLRKEQEDRLRTGYSALQNSGSGIAVTDIEGRLTYANPALMRLWGISSEEEVKNLNLLDFLSDSGYLERVIEAVRSGASWSGELTMRPRDRDQIIVSASVMADVNVDEEITGLVFSLMDVTEEKRAKEQLEAYARELSDKNRQMEHDLAMAREIQLAFLPSSYPVIPRGAPKQERALDFAHLYIPGGMIGGDFFDILTLQNGKAGLLMADVSGHGVRSALVVATLRGMVEELIAGASEPAKFMRSLSKAYNSIFSLRDDYTFVTAFFAVMDTATGQLRYSNAGHPAPFILKNNSGESLILKGNDGEELPAIGMVEDAQYTENNFVMNNGDTLLMYTDGIYEQVNEQHKEYGEDALRLSLQHHSEEAPQTMLQAMADDVRTFMHKEEFDDDVCMLAVKYLGHSDRS